MIKKALVIVDMQNDFLDGVLGNERCLATVPEVVNLIKDSDYSALVITQDTHFENYLSTQEGRKLPVAHCIKGTDGWSLNASVQKAIDLRGTNRDASIFVMQKTTFGGLSLIDILRDELTGYDEIHFCGVCTGICVISNVMIAKATLTEAKIAVIERACACVTEESHKTAIEAMRTCQVDII